MIDPELTSPSAEDADAISGLPGADRYAHFITLVAGTGTAWGLWGDDGWVLGATDGGQELFPLWPAEIYAARCAVGAWADCEPSELPLETLLDELLPLLAEDAMLPAVFMTVEQLGVMPTPADLARDLQAALNPD